MGGGGRESVDGQGRERWEEEGGTEERMEEMRERKERKLEVLSHTSFPVRFRSKLSDVYGVGTKKRPVVYCGRGRPPKKALMAVHMDGQVGSGGELKGRNRQLGTDHWTKE